MKKLAILLLYVSISLFAQITIDRAGDDWHVEIEKAIVLIKTTSPSHYANLYNNVNRVEFWSENYSSNQKNTIVVAKNDVLLASTNNLAAVLVHESCHIMLANMQMNPSEEEVRCYQYELQFLQMLSQVEPELIMHCKQQINNIK